MRLQRLTGLERDKLENEYKELRETIDYLRGILGDSVKLDGVVKDELQEATERFGDERRSEIIPFQFGEFNTILWYDNWAYRDSVTSTFVNRNSYATYALEEALQLKDAHGGTVTVLALNRDETEKVLFTALAKGADRAINVKRGSIAETVRELGIQGFDVGLEMSGHPGAFNDLLHNVYHGGKVALLGLLPAGTGVDWDQVIFSDRQQSIVYLCETPQLIEKRLFAIARMLQDGAEG